MGTSHPEQDATDAHAETVVALNAVDSSDELALLSRILTKGIDQGCLLRISDDDSLAFRPHQIATLLEDLSSRPAVDHAETATSDPFEKECAPQSLPETDEPGVVVLTQRCDLVKPIADEPLVEVAVGFHTTDNTLISVAKRGSVQHLHLTDTETGAWLVDLRTKGYIPKPLIGDLEHWQLLPDLRARRRFATRLGARSSRDALPARLVAGFQAHLRGWLDDSQKRRNLCEHFSDFLIHESKKPDEWVLLGLVGSTEKGAIEQADSAFEELLDIIRKRLAKRGSTLKLAEESSAVSPKDMSVHTYFNAYKLDFNNISYGMESAENQADPTR